MTYDMGILDFGGYPEIHAAGYGEAHVIGDGRVRLVLFDWYRIDGVWRKRVVGTVTRPVSTIPEDMHRYCQDIFGQDSAPRAGGRRAEIRLS